MFASVRGYYVHMATPRDLAERVAEDFADLLSRQPGFVAYDFLDCGDREAMSISVFEDAAQAEASRALAVRWTTERLPDMELAGPPNRLHSDFVNGIKTMPVRFTPTKPLGSL